MKQIIFTLIFIGIIIYISIVGWQKETASGEHTGYITSVERKGLFFKTSRIYLKTDTQSSQEKSYCVVDPEIYSQLIHFSEQKTQITVSYLSWIIPGIKNCWREKSIIFDVIPTSEIVKREKDAEAIITAYEEISPAKKIEIADIKSSAVEILGRNITFFEIEQILGITEQDELQECLNKINKNDPLGLFTKNSTEEERRQDCIKKYLISPNNPIGI